MEEHGGGSGPLGAPPHRRRPKCAYSPRDDTGRKEWEKSCRHQEARVGLSLPPAAVAETPSEPVPARELCLHGAEPPSQPRGAWDLADPPTGAQTRQRSAGPGAGTAPAPAHRGPHIQPQATTHPGTRPLLRDGNSKAAAAGLSCHRACWPGTRPLSQNPWAPPVRGPLLHPQPPQRGQGTSRPRQTNQTK